MFDNYYCSNKIRAKYKEELKEESCIKQNFSSYFKVYLQLFMTEKTKLDLSLYLTFSDPWARKVVIMTPLISINRGLHDAPGSIVF